MKPKTKWITPLIVLTSLAMAGLLGIQVYLLKNAYQFKQQGFDQNVAGAMNSVVQKLETMETLNRVIQVSVGVDSSDMFGFTNMHIFEKGDDKNPRKWTLWNESTLPGHIRLDSNKVILRLNQTRQVKLLKIIGDKFEHTSDVMFDTVQHAGIHEINLDKYTTDKYTTEKYTLFNVVVDSMAYPVYLDRSTPGRMIIDPELARSRRTLVDKVLEQYLIPDIKPIQARIDSLVLDSLICRTMRENDFGKSCIYGIINTQNDSLIFATPRNQKDKLRISKFRTFLYPHDIVQGPYMLVLHLPNQTRILLGKLTGVIFSTLIFIAIIIFAFFLVIHAILSQKKLSVLLTDFINNMTHEFKTPISTIALASETLTHDQVITNQSRLKKYGQMIREESTRMRKQVEKILEMAAMESGDFELKKENADIHNILKDVVSNWQNKLQETGGQLSEAYHAEHTLCHADAMHMGHVFHNLIDNAVKYTEQTPEITIQTQNQNHMLQIDFKDNGIGIPREEQKHIFQKYYRVSTGNVHNVKGFGMGLSYIKHIMDVHDGSVSVISDPGNGATFRITLPYCKEGDKS